MIPVTPELEPVREFEPEGEIEETYVVATNEHLRKWDSQGEIELGEYYDRFHKWISAIPVVSAVGDIVESGPLLLKAQRLAGNSSRRDWSICCGITGLPHYLLFYQILDNACAASLW